MNRLLILSALCAGCSASIANPEPEANGVDLNAVQAELDSLKAVVELNTAKVGVTPEQADAIRANTAKAGVTPEQADAIRANTAKAGVTPEQADAILANTAKVGVTPEQADAILANTAKVGLSDSQIVTLRHAENVADQSLVSDRSNQRETLPRYTGNETPFRLVDITIPADGRYLIVYHTQLFGNGYCWLTLNEQRIKSLINGNNYEGATALDLSTDDTLDIRCSAYQSAFHLSSDIMAITIL